MEECDCSIDAIIVKLKFLFQWIVLVQGNIVCPEAFETGGSLISTRAESLLLFSCTIKIALSYVGFIRGA